jgi:hypothetical protein
MMDSQEMALENGATQEEKKVEELEKTVETTETADTEVASQVEIVTDAEPVTEEPSILKEYKTKDEVLDRIREIARDVDYPQKDEIDYLKSTFYKLHIAEKDANYKNYIDSGGDPEKYVMEPDEDEDVFKAEMAIIKDKRSRIFKEQESEKEKNLKKKLDIIEKVKAMATTPEDANKSYNEFKKLQQDWKDIKSVPAEKANELWKNYQLYVEQFYDLLKLNSEAREYDFRKNLEIKTHLCETAEKLAEESDVISAFHQLQKLHQEYRETGPVSKELREEVWNRFKVASTTINKCHQQHFEEMRSKEEENLEKKTALCEKVEAIAAEENKGSSDWEKHTKDIIDIQTEWKTIGFAPQKMNVKIFERFRAACDEFFGKKAEYFKQLKEKFNENTEKKKMLCEQAETLKDSTEWKATADKLMQLQKEWKAIGVVPKKLGDALWKQFLGACNHFFEARNAANAGQHNEEHDNLAKKHAIIEKLQNIGIEAGKDTQEIVQNLTDEYNAIGHVPFKEKDNVYNEYHEVLDKLYKELNISVAKRKLNNFRNNLKNAIQDGGNALNGERARLMRQYEAIKQEVQTYENNLGFLNSSSKKGNSLIDEMNHKVQKLKDDLELVKQKIKAIDEEYKQD